MDTTLAATSRDATFGKGDTTGSGAKNTDTIYVQDAFVTYSHSDAFEVEAGFPVTPAIPGEGELEASMLPGGEAAATTHIGPYDAMRPTYEAITEWLGEHDAVPAGAPWEVYLSDPDDQPDPATWRTDIIQPYRAMAHAG